MTNLIGISAKKANIQQVTASEVIELEDVLSVEEPLEIRLIYRSGNQLISSNVSVTMRTPGNDEDLAIGFLFTEGIINSIGDIKDVSHLAMNCSDKKENIIVVELMDHAVPNLGTSERNFYTTSSCGVCGKGSIQSIRTVSIYQNIEKSELIIHQEYLFGMGRKLRLGQLNFEASGGIHASGLFNLNADLLALREDVGRHNALDKLIGHYFQQGELPLQEKILLLSGRASFELIQKAAMAGIRIVASIGAPSSLALELAVEFDITLIGFLKENRFNIYHCGKNIVLE